MQAQTVWRFVHEEDGVEISPEGVRFLKGALYGMVVGSVMWFGIIVGVRWLWSIL